MGYFCFLPRLALTLVFATQIMKLGENDFVVLLRKIKVSDVATDAKLRVGGKMQTSLLFHSPCTNISVCYANHEIRRRLGKMQTSLLFHSPCTNFAVQKLDSNGRTR